MPRLEYHGVLARPGTYRRKNGKTITKTWEELKRSFNLTPELNLSLGHPMTPDGKYRSMSVKDYIGRVSKVINEEKQVIEGIFKIYDEGWDKIPSHIQDKLVNDEAIEISAGYMGSPGALGKQSLMLHDHIAILAGGESPVCPLDQCGINITLEGEDGDVIMTYEESTSTKDEEPKEEVKEQPPVTAQEPKLVTFTPEQFQELISTLKPPVQETTEDAGAEPEPIEEITPEEVTAPPEPSLEPERAFPAGKPTKGKSPYLKDSGVIEIPSDIFLGGTKRKTTT